VKLAIEQLHLLMADRACVNTTKKALIFATRSIRSAVDARLSRSTSITIWWDPADDVADRPRGKDSLPGFHGADCWCREQGHLNDRGMMGDGVIDIQIGARGSRHKLLPAIRRSRFFKGLWGKPMVVLRTCTKRHRSAV